jgi:hypothetical protein
VEEDDGALRFKVQRFKGLGVNGGTLECFSYKKIPALSNRD